MEDYTALAETRKDMKPGRTRTYKLNRQIMAVILELSQILEIVLAMVTETTSIPDLDKIPDTTKIPDITIPETTKIPGMSTVKRNTAAAGERKQRHA